MTPFSSTIAPEGITNKPLAGQRIGVFGRGGCGKSTCTVLLARALANNGYSVCVVDADSTNEGLAEALGANRSPAPLLDWLGGTVFSGGPVGCPVDDPMPIEAARVHLEDLPSRYVGETAQGIRIVVAGKIGPLGPGAGCDGPITKIARDFVLETEGTPPVTLVDFKAGIEDASRGVVTSLDWVIMVVDPTRAALRAAVTMKTLLRELREGRPPATQHLKSPELVELTLGTYRAARTRGILYVLNKCPDAETEDHMRHLLLSVGINVAASVQDLPEIRQNWFDGAALQGNTAGLQMFKLVHALEQASGNCARANSTELPAEKAAPC
jgi:CO dehydrogenase maturation factor